LFLDKAVKRGVETFGPKLTRSDVTLQSVSLSLFLGSGTVKGLVVGNPQGFKTPSAIRIGTVSLSLKPLSLLSDKIVVKSINFQGAEITFETDLRGNNLKKILANMQEETKRAKTLQVDELVISGGKVNVSVTAFGGQSATIPLPEVHLQALGTGPEGITQGELVKKVLEAIEKGATQAAAGIVTDISKGALYFTKDAGKTGSNAVDTITKGIGNMFKKK
jgi:uncharacterized protein involved in outer membrane biogenesis